jgi:hypothetical protein
LLIFLTQCSPSDYKNTDKIEKKSDSSQVAVPNEDDNQEKKPSSSDEKTKDNVHSENNITEKVKNYIVNGQENKPEAQKLKWSKTFLNHLDIESLYKQYIDSGKGKTSDLESFANYMTLNAPIQTNWKELFEKDLYDTYGEKVAKIEHLNDDLYQAYIIKDSLKIPYVVVSSRTGYFHG